MLYYERVKSEDAPAVRRPHSALDVKADEVEEVPAEKEKGSMFCLQDAVECEPAEEAEEEVPVIRARVVRSVSLGRDEEVGGTSGKQEAAADCEAPPQTSSLSLGPAAKPDSEVPPAVDLPTTLAVPAEAPSPIPDAPAIDEPQISLPRTVDLRA
jgi:hypothetical protein